MAKKLTPWFPATLPPVRDGVYQVRPLPGVVWLSLYRKGVWHGTTSDSRNADNAERFGLKTGPTKCHIVDWRGLAEQPK